MCESAFRPRGHWDRRMNNIQELIFHPHTCISSYLDVRKC